MPVTTHTLETLTEANSNHVSDRHAASERMTSSVTESEWPLVTKSVYVALARGSTAENADAQAVALNLPLRRLCAVRATLGTALLMLDGALRSFNPEVAGNPTDDTSRRVYNRLRTLHGQVNKQLMRVPLEVR